MSIAIRNQPRFENSKTLIVTGERGEEAFYGKGAKEKYQAWLDGSLEAKGRANYAEFENDRTHTTGKMNRTVHHWRPILRWPEAQVWGIIERYKVNPHPAYNLGWGRLSCAACIFGNKHQWASLRQQNPTMFDRIDELEQELDFTIDNKQSVVEIADKGTPYDHANDPAKVGDIFVWNWKLPSGAFGDSTGPT
jgi:3'-phosphoadenosine 5'-phosphosulfate sulfotransferase (PAPS reductase)/FAD synthetase